MSRAHPASQEIEAWTQIPGYEGRYQVSSYGRIKSLPRVEIRSDGRRRTVRGGPIKAHIGSWGYPEVSLRRNGKVLTFRVHRLVGLAFVRGRNALHRELGHLDNNRANPRADNLKWVSPAENCSHKLAHGTHQAGDKAGNRILTSAKVAEIRLRGGTAKELAERHGVSRYTIYDIWQGVNWKASPTLR